MGRPQKQYDELKRCGKLGNKVQFNVRIDEEDYRTIKLCSETLDITMAEALHYLMWNGVLYDGTR